MTYAYAYNDNNQLTEVRIPGHGSITHTSYNWTRPEAITLPGGSTKRYEYGPLMRVKRITSRDPDQDVIVDYQYGYDRMDNITTKATEHGEYAYGYDDLYRLINADNPVLSDESFTYDPVGNRLTSSSAGNWTYNPNNELQAYNGVSFQYDANGNTIQKTEGSEITQYIYNEEDRLVRVEDGTSNVIAEYYYDPFGRRLWKEIDGERTCFLYSDEGLVAEMDETGNVIKPYGWQPGSTWTTDPLFMKQGGQYYFYHNDHLGTPRKMTSASGEVVWSAKYESFGRAEVEVETVVNNLRFPGQYQDYETGLHYNYQRYYDPGMGRYFKTDPIGFDGDINFYSYANNNSIDNIDPFGQEVLQCRRQVFGDWGKIYLIPHCYHVVDGRVYSWHPQGAEGITDYEVYNRHSCNVVKCCPEKQLEFDKCVDDSSRADIGNEGSLWVPTIHDCCTWSARIIGKCWHKTCANCCP